MENIEIFNDLKREIVDLYDQHDNTLYKESFNNGYYVALTQVLEMLEEYFGGEYYEGE